MVVWCPLSSVRGCVRIALQIRINLLELGDNSGGNPFVSVVNLTGYEPKDRWFDSSQHLSLLHHYNYSRRPLHINIHALQWGAPYLH